MTLSIVIDACTIINLFNAGALGDVLSLERLKVWVTPLIVGECGTDCASELLRLSGLDVVHFVEDAAVPIDRFLELVEAHDIGDGENEAIAVCEANGWSFCSDDAPARRLGQATLGQNAVVGGLRLLRWAVEDGVLVCDVAFEHYKQMLVAGGFLPRVEQSFFCDLVNGC